MKAKLLYYYHILVDWLKWYLLFSSMFRLSAAYGGRFLAFAYCKECDARSVKGCFSCCTLCIKFSADCPEILSFDCSKHMRNAFCIVSTLRWAFLTILCIGFCHTGPISLCVDLFVFISVYFVCSSFVLHVCCIIVSTVGWTWWDWSLIIRTYLPSLLWHCWLGHLTSKSPSLIWPTMCLVGC